jgi:LCCL domain
MQSTSTGMIFLSPRSLTPVLLAGLVLLSALARAQSADATSQPAAPSAASNPTPLALDLGDCPDNADDLGQGKTYSCACPALADPAPIYGSDVYAEDSGLCTAAVHAGTLKRDTAGSVSFQVVASPPVFKGATRNGIKSEVWPKPAAAAFQFVAAK